MITDEEAKKAAEILIEYCNEYGGCSDCPFYRSPNCELNAPVTWQL